MPTFYVATRARYVIDEAEARRLGEPELKTRQAAIVARKGRDLPVEIHVVRLAKDGEVEMGRWHRLSAKPANMQFTAIPVIVGE